MKQMFFLVVAVLMLSACDPKVKPDEDISNNTGNTDATTESRDGAQVGFIDEADKASATVVIDGVNRDVSYARDAIKNPANILTDRTIYFDYDSSQVTSSDQEILKHHGRYLALNSTVKIRIEGHTDERGSREYNVALADRRAQTVKKLLMFQGASSRQIIVISYGEEKPAAFGHDESVWQLNRRVEIVYGE